MDNDSPPAAAKARKKDDALGNVTAKSFESAPLMMTTQELEETLCISLRKKERKRREESDYLQYQD